MREACRMVNEIFGVAKAVVSQREKKCVIGNFNSLRF